MYPNKTRRGIHVREIRAGPRKRQDKQRQSFLLGAGCTWLYACWTKLTEGFIILKLRIHMQSMCFFVDMSMCHQALLIPAVVGGGARSDQVSIVQMLRIMLTHYAAICLEHGELESFMIYEHRKGTKQMIQSGVTLSDFKKQLQPAI